MRWLWAAYRSGLWPELFDSGLTTEAFSDRITEVIASVDHDWIIEAPGDTGNRPVALVLGESRAAGRGVEPHVDWFPWATPRNKLEGAAQFLKSVGRTYKIMIYASDDVSFWNRFTKYRMLSRGCKIRNYFAPGEDAMFFYTVGPD